MLGANIKEKTRPFCLGRGLGIIVKGDWRRRKEESFELVRIHYGSLRKPRARASRKEKLSPIQ